MDTSGAAAPDLETNRKVVLDFYREGLVDRNPPAAFERYVSPDFIEHKPDVPEGTRKAAIAYLQGLMDELPDSRWELVRSISEGELVFLHARFMPSPGAPEYVIADVFRVQSGLIVEHWDVVGGPQESMVNPHPRV